MLHDQEILQPAPIIIVPNDATIEITQGGCVGAFTTMNARGGKSFHFSRVVQCAALSDCILHEPTSTIIAIRAHAKGLEPDILAAHKRWVGEVKESAT